MWCKFLSKMALKLDLDGDLSKGDVTKLNAKTPPAFECDICHKTFTKRVWVERHIGAVHEKKRPFQCHKCDKNFPYKQSMPKHIDFVHEQKKRPTFSCDICGKTFTRLG